jgi:tetratricopeptide (TPR) repeat protein
MMDNDFTNSPTKNTVVYRKVTRLRVATLGCLITCLIFVSLACQFSASHPAATPTTALTPAPGMSKSWSSPPTPLPEITFPPPVEDQTLVDKAESIFQQGKEAYNGTGYKEAIEAFNAALEINPRHSQAYYYRGWAYLNQNDQGYLTTYLQYNDQAVMDFSRSIALAPDSWGAYYGRGVCYHRRAQVEPLRENRKLWQQLALDDLDRALELDQEQGQARGERVSIYLDRGECDKALDDLLTPYWSNIPTSDEIIYYINTYQCQKNYAEAFRLVNEEMAKGSSAKLYWEHGMIYAGQEDYEKALEDLDAAVKEWPGGTTPGTLWYNRAALEYYLGNYDLAKEYYQKGKPNTWIDWGSPYYFMGKIALSEENTDQAIADFIWAEQTLDEGEFLNATRNELSKLGALPAYVPTLTRTPEPVLTPALTPAYTPIPTEMSGQLLLVFGGFVFIQVDAKLLNEIAIRSESEELDDSQTARAWQILDSFLQEEDGIILQAVVPDTLGSDWTRAVAIYVQTKDIYHQWANHEIKPKKVVAEMKPLLDELDQILPNVENILSHEYGFNLDDLTQQRADALAYVDRIFGPTTTPTPKK